MVQVEQVSVPTQAEAAKHFIDLTRGEDGEYVDPSARLGDRMVTATRLRVDGHEIPAELLEEIRSTVASLRSQGESAAVAEADNFAATILAMEDIDFTTGTRKVVAAPVVGGIILPTEAMH